MSAEPVPPTVPGLPPCIPTAEAGLTRGTELAWRLARQDFPYKGVIGLGCLLIIALPFLTFAFELIHGVWGFLAYFLAGAAALGLVGLWQWRREAQAGATVIELAAQALRPGEPTAALLIQEIRQPLRAVVVRLAAKEEVKYRQGTDTRTEERQVFNQEVFRLEAPGPAESPVRRRFELTVPANVMPSFKTKNNQVVWQLIVEVTPETGAVVRREFGLVVHPAFTDEQLPEGGMTGGNAEVRVRLDRGVLRPGEAVTGEVTCTPDVLAQAQGATVYFGWHTQGKGDEDHEHLVTQELTPQGAWFNSDGALPLKLPPLPVAPVSYEGQLLQVRWRVKAVVKLGWLRKHEAEAVFLVSPAVMPAPEAA